MIPNGRKPKGVFQQFGALSYVQNIHEQYVKLHEHHYLTYIEMIVIQMSQNSIRTTYPFLCTNLYNMIYTQIGKWTYLLYS